MRLLLVSVAMLFLSGCAVLGRIADYGAAANTEAVETSVFTICNGASIGAIRRQFDTPEKVQTWKTLCADDTDFSPSVSVDNPQ